MAEARRVDVATAIENGMWVIRADVAGQRVELTSHGSSAIVDPTGIVRTAAPLSEVVIAAAIEVPSRIAASDDTPN